MLGIGRPQDPTDAQHSIFLRLAATAEQILFD